MKIKKVIYISIFFIIAVLFWNINSYGADFKKDDEVQCGKKSYWYVLDSSKPGTLAYTKYIDEKGKYHFYQEGTVLTFIQKMSGNDNICKVKDSKGREKFIKIANLVEKGKVEEPKGEEEDTEFGDGYSGSAKINKNISQANKWYQCKGKTYLYELQQQYGTLGEWKKTNNYYKKGQKIQIVGQVEGQEIWAIQKQGGSGMVYIRKDANLVEIDGPNDTKVEGDGGEGTDETEDNSDSTSIYTKPEKSLTGGSAQSLDDMISDADSFVKQGKTQYDETALQDFSSTMYNILLSIGVAVALIVGIIIGIKYMMGSIEEKANYKQMLIPYLVGCVVVFGAFGIWKLVVTILESV